MPHETNRPFNKVAIIKEILKYQIETLEDALALSKVNVDFEDTIYNFLNFSDFPVDTSLGVPLIVSKAWRRIERLLACKNENIDFELSEYLELYSLWALNSKKTEIMRNFSRDIYTYSIAKEAAKNGYTKTMEVILRFYDEYNEEIYHREALTLAAENGHFEIVKSLLTYYQFHSKIKMVLEGKEDCMALSEAAKNGHLETLKLLVKPYQEAGVLTRAVKYNHHQSFGVAIRNGHFKVVQWFTLELYPLLDLLDEVLHNQRADAQGPLCYAVQSHNIETTRLVFQQYDKDALQSRFINDPDLFYVAAENRNMNVFRFVLEQYRTYNLHTENLVRNNCILGQIVGGDGGGNIEAIRFLIELYRTEGILEKPFRSPNYLPDCLLRMAILHHRDIEVIRLLFRESQLLGLLERALSSHAILDAAARRRFGPSDIDVVRLVLSQYQSPIEWIGAINLDPSIHSPESYELLSNIRDAATREVAGEAVTGLGVAGLLSGVGMFTVGNQKSQDHPEEVSPSELTSPQGNVVGSEDLHRDKMI